MPSAYNPAVATSMDIPHTQNTAPVLEFRCLYTQDLRRKQKRWQDGRLKYHTFNKRVMVYDERSNFMGDTHWREDSELAEGDELELERGGVLVEVGDCIGKRDQDLTELLDKRVKDREERAAAKVTNGSPQQLSNAPVRPQATPAASAYLRPKPLNAILTPTGHYGKAAIATTSPFEERQRLNAVNESNNENKRPAKRQRRTESTQSKNGYAQNLMGATLNLSSSRPPSTATIRYASVKATPFLVSKGTATIEIDLTSEDEENAAAAKSRPDVSREGHHSVQTSAKSQRKPRRSPPPKSSYASNLTGVALSLSRPERTLSKVHKQTPQQVREPISQSATELSSSLPDSSFVEIENVVPEPVRKAKKLIEKGITTPTVPGPKSTKAPRIPSPKLDPTPPDSRRSPPRMPKELRGGTDESLKPPRSKTNPLIAVVPPKSNYATPDMRPNPATSVVHGQSLAVNKATPDRLMSTLKIKSRPPRRMMMLMARPPPRAAPARKIAEQGHSRPPPIFRDASDEALVSDVAFDTESSFIDMEGNNQTSVVGKQPNVPSGDPSSPSLDEYINLQPSSSPPIAGAKPPQRKIDDAPISTTKDATRPSLVVFSADSVRRRAAASSSPQKSRDDGEIEASEASKTNTKFQSLKTFPVASDSLSSKGQSLSHVHASPDGSPDVCISTDKAVHIEPYETQEIVEDGAISPVLEKSISGGTPVTAPVLPGVQILGQDNSNASKMPDQTNTQSHLPKGVEAATDKFISIIKSSVSSSSRSTVLNSLRGHDDDPTENVLPQIFKSSDEKPALPDAPGKSSPPRPSSEIRANTASTAAEPADSNVETQKGPAVPALTLKTTASASGKFKLSNPATRGVSLQQLAASTIDALISPSTKAMPPPAPPRNPRRSERPVPQAREDPQPHDIERVKDQGVTVGGPWSRESFDLFGTWRPPGRIDAGTSGASG